MSNADVVRAVTVLIRTNAVLLRTYPVTLIFKKMYSLDKTSNTEAKLKKKNLNIFK